MAVKLTPRQEMWLGFSVGFVGTALVLWPSMRRSYIKHQATMAQLEKERIATWKAAGIVSERTRRGVYDYNGHVSVPTAMMDFDFEKIRLMEEGR